MGRGRKGKNDHLEQDENFENEFEKEETKDSDDGVAEELESDEPMVDIYEELGIITAATTVEIKSAYRKLALKYHPGEFWIRLKISCLMWRFSILMSRIFNFI